MQFFDKMKEKVAPALNDASKKLKESVDQVGEKIQETKLKSQLSTLLKERGERLQDLGAKVHTLHHGEGIGIDDLTQELAAVDEVDVRIAAKQAEIDAHASEEA